MKINCHSDRSPSACEGAVEEPAVSPQNFAARVEISTSWKKIGGTKAGTTVEERRFSAA